VRGVRERVTPLGDDREPGPDLTATLAIVREGVLADLVVPD
jgi:hypothetical protein